MVADLLSDPLYIEFVARYQPSALAFVEEVCGNSVSDDQKDLLVELENPTARISVASGTSTGKTMGFGRIALWHLLCFPVAVYDGKTEIGSNTYIGAAAVKQVGDGVWKEINDAVQAMKTSEVKWLNHLAENYIVVKDENIYIKGYKSQWFIKKFACPKGQSISIAGKHRFNQLIIVDEAAGVGDDHFDVINGTQTQGGNRTILASQGVKNSGFFYETHHSLSQANGGQWVALTFSSENSPFASDEWLKNILIESGGRDSPEYVVRVLGGFVENAQENLLTRTMLSQYIGAEPTIKQGEAWGWMLLVDVGMGEYRDDSVCIKAKVIGNGDFGDDARRVDYVDIPVLTNSKNMREFRGLITEQYNLLSNATIVIDAGGSGNELAKMLEEDGLNVQRVMWGNPCFKKTYKDRYLNLRACAMVRFRDAVRQARTTFMAMEKRLKEKFLMQGSRLPYSFTDTGSLRYKMMGKEEMRKQGIKSPDLIDAASFAYLEGVYYNVSDAAFDEDGDVGESAEDLLEQAKAALGNVV